MPAPARRPPPPVQVVAHLAAAKARGIPATDFDDLWREAVRAVVWPHDTTHRRQWREALRNSRAEMLAAYSGEETDVARVFRAIPPALLGAEPERAHDLDRVAA